jgi:hypothetical protein
MTAPPDVVELHDFLARASRRLAWMRATEGASVGLVVAIALAIAGWPAPTTLARLIVAAIACVVAGIALRALLFFRRPTPIAVSIEQRAPVCRNLVITASELTAGAPVSGRIGAIVNREAARIVRGLDLSALYPARNAVMALIATVVLWGATLASTRARGSERPRTIRGAFASATGIDAVDVTIIPPAYTGRPTQSAHDPARIEALVGSRVRLAVRARASRIVLETLGGRDTLANSAAGAFTGELRADADGYIAIQPLASGQQGSSRFIGLSVISDNAPRVRITAPAKDLFLRDAHHTIDLAVEAGDDIALASLRLRYTKVSGSGERFTFTDGELPLDVARKDAATWTAHASWRLDGLALEPGDLVVYRAVATDNRPGATPAESDSYIAEILAPGGVAAPGFALDPDVERYAVSQQMVIVKTERLAARRAAMGIESYADSAHELAAEQRKVRAEFVFMMGGEIADETNDALADLNEEQEAEGESDLLAGRMQNRGRIALLRAIRSMSRAAAALTTAELPPALAHERAALTQLERAFSHTRIILRALTERERLDLSRRLTGTLTDAASSVRPAVEPEPETRVTSLRRALAGIATLAGTRPLGSDAALQASSLAAAMLRIDPSSKTLQDAAALLARSASAVTNDRSGDARAMLDSAAVTVATMLRVALRAAPANGSNADLDRLSGALTDALRRPRGAR